MSQRLIIILFLLCLTFTSFSQKVLKITTIEESNAIFQDYIEVYVDSTNSLEFDQISSKDFSKYFVPVSEFEEETSLSNTYWLHFILDYNPLESYSMGMQIPFNNQIVEVYTLMNGSMLRQQTGLSLPTIANEEIIPNSSIIQISGSGQIEYYLKLNSVKFRDPDFNLAFVDLYSEFRQTNRSNIFQSFFIGILIFMMIYGVFLYYHSREYVYLYYVLYIVGIAIWSLVNLGYQFIYSLPKSIWWYSMISIYVAFYFYIKFVRSFINTAVELPKWDKALKILQVVMLCAAVGLHVPPMFLDIRETINFFHGFIFLIIIILIISFIIKLIRSNVPFGRIIWIGTSLLILGTVGSFIRFFTMDSVEAVDEYLYEYQRIGILLELTVFSYGLSLRYKIMEREKRQYQTQLIDQLKENTRIQEEANRELEGKVQRRTAEIAEKNSMLSHQNEEIEAQRDELEIQRNVVLAQKNEIVDSITYAQRIQAAMLPPDTYFTELLHENFIFYKPRDIVSGDFYWIKQVNMSIILVAADCTGHGVPGALMSMLGMSYLDEIVQRREITQANEVLNELRKQIKHSLRQHGQMDESRDGIDLALCVFDLKNREMQYSGANNPLYLIRDVKGVPELNEIKADPMPLGYYQGKDTSFTNHSIQLEMGDTFYLFSDGFIDQKGGKDNKKFMSKNFKNLLLKIHDQPMHEQKEILDKTLSDWIGDNSQMDDVLVIGVRV